MRTIPARCPRVHRGALVGGSVRMGREFIASAGPVSSFPFKINGAASPTCCCWSAGPDQPLVDIGSGSSWTPFVQAGSRCRFRPRVSRSRGLKRARRTPDQPLRRWVEAGMSGLRWGCTPDRVGGNRLSQRSGTGSKRVSPVAAIAAACRMRCLTVWDQWSHRVNCCPSNGPCCRTRAAHIYAPLRHWQS